MGLSSADDGPTLVAPRDSEFLLAAVAAHTADRNAGIFTRFSNCFWIGQPLLPFAARIPLRGGRSGSTIAK
jgi:hypothetical protein